MRLRHSDWNKLLGTIAQLNSDMDPDTLGDRVIAAANRLISGEMTAFDFFDEKGAHTGVSWNDPPNSISASEYEIFANVAHEHPFFPSVFGGGRRDPMTITDHLTKSEFHKTGIYNEFYRIYGIDQQLLIALPVSPDLIVTYTHNRVQRNFSDEDRQMIGLIAPHLRNAIRIGREVERLISTSNHLDSALARKRTGVVIFDRAGTLRYVSGFSQTLIDKYYSRGDLRNDGVPARLANWIENCQSQRNADPMISEFTLKLELAESTLTVCISFNNLETVVLLEETVKPSAASLYPLGLTRRQSEILFWVSQGKTDQDIACLLGISPRTVHKHLENIYIRLGVETRTSAMSIAVQHY